MAQDKHNTAETSDAVIALAQRYEKFTWSDLMALACSDDTGTTDRFCADVRSMAMSLIRQAKP